MEILLKWAFFGLAGWFFWWAFGDEKSVELDPNRVVIPDRPLTPERLAQLRQARDEWMRLIDVDQKQLLARISRF